MKPRRPQLLFSSIIVCGRVGAVEKRTGLKQSCGFIIDEYRKEKKIVRECVVFLVAIIFYIKGNYMSEKYCYFYNTWETSTYIVLWQKEKKKEFEVWQGPARRAFEQLYVVVAFNEIYLTFNSVWFFLCNKTLIRILFCILCLLSTYLHNFSSFLPLKFNKLIKLKYLNKWIDLCLCGPLPCFYFYILLPILLFLANYFKVFQFPLIYW